MIPEQSGKDKNVINVSILLTVALCIGVYLIATTVLIAKDGVTFVKYAMQLEIAPVKTMIMEYQHPGYPWLILTAYKMTAFLRENTTLSSWIYCGQGVTLIFRLLAITILYFTARRLFGARLGFWGTLIFVVLPRPAEYGSDVLSDWPHLFFLAAGLFLLLQGATGGRWRLFGFAGLFAGAGYLIRPECFLLVVSGGLWLGLQLLRPRPRISKGKAVSALILLLMGFLALALPYMILKGALFPKKNVGQFVQSSQPREVHAQSHFIVPQIREISRFTLWNISKALGKLVGNIGETLMWFFVPFLFIGMYTWFKTRTWREPDSFIIAAFVIVNIPIMIWLYCKYDYMSDRHTLPLLLFAILYVPVGLQESAIWLRQRFSSHAGLFAATSRDERFWFLVLLVMGVLICVPKLLGPIRSEKQGYKAAANWLKANTDSAARIAVPDKRISFYAERTELVYEDERVPEKAEYIVKIFQKQKDPFTYTKRPGKVEYEYLDKAKRGTNVVIYRNF
jgi:hypothetical protein